MEEATDKDTHKLRIHLPPCAIKVVQRDGRSLVFDPLRRRYVALTPEEWVRQHFVRYLIDHLGYPVGTLANEVTIALYRTSKRCDTVVYSPMLVPWVLIEYKAPTVAITESTFDQIARYNLALHVPYLVVSNGRQHYCCKINYDTGEVAYLKGIPRYDELAETL